jgi:hypothetical protein
MIIMCMKYYKFDHVYLDSQELRSFVITVV